MARGNTEIEDYTTMIAALGRYEESLREHCQNLRQGVEAYEETIGDDVSITTSNKVKALCSDIDPKMIERVVELKGNLQKQLEILIEVHEQAQRMMADE